MKTRNIHMFKIWRARCFYVMPGVRNVLIQVISSATVPVEGFPVKPHSEILLEDW